MTATQNAKNEWKAFSRMRYLHWHIQQRTLLRSHGDVNQLEEDPYSTFSRSDGTMAREWSKNINNVANVQPNVMVTIAIRFMRTRSEMRQYLYAYFALNALCCRRRYILCAFFSLHRRRRQFSAQSDFVQTTIRYVERCETSIVALPVPKMA